MRYIKNPKSFETGLQHKETKEPVMLSFARSWLRGLFSDKCWSEGTTAEARTKLTALSHIVDAVKGHEEDGAEWCVTDEDHEVLCKQALAFDVDGDMSVFRVQFHMFKLAIVSATSEPSKPAEAA